MTKHNGVSNGVATYTRTHKEPQGEWLKCDNAGEQVAEIEGAEYLENLKRYLADAITLIAESGINNTEDTQ
jgi:hypothetical protein